MNEEQRAQIARDEEIARQWDEEERQRAMAEAKTSKKIDWNDPSVIRAKRKRKKKSIPRKSTRKRQKLEEDAEKEELKGFLDIIPREEVPMEVESLSTKFLIVDWKTCVLTENFILVKERYSASRLEGYDLMLWGDLHTLFEHDEEDEIWKNQNEYNVISWSLYDFYEVEGCLKESSAKEEV
ncbi:hypothetical protein Tco_0548521 [Tanacetum coccineum]